MRLDVDLAAGRTNANGVAVASVTLATKKKVSSLSEAESEPNLPRSASPPGNVQLLGESNGSIVV